MSGEVFQAKLRNAHISPRKARLVVDLVRGKGVQRALDELRFLKKKAGYIVATLVRSAIANAKDRSAVDVDNLRILEIFVGDGVTLKRHMPRAQGRATPIRKRHSNIVVRLKEVIQKQRGNCGSKS